MQTALERDAAGIFLDLLRGIARTTQDAADRLAGLLEEEVAVPAPAVRSGWGRRILRLQEMGLEEGLTTRVISQRIGQHDEPNTSGALTQLEKAGLVEIVPDSTPRRWRLTREHRRNRTLRASRLIPEGSWTTYGDIAIAMSGNVNVARSIARVARHNPAFANPHRVLGSGGVILPGWEDDDANGPEECERRLKEEGITMSNGRVANGDDDRIGFERIIELLKEQDVHEDAGI